MEQEVFVVLNYYSCDDDYYGYNETLDSIYLTWEKAKASVDTFLASIKPWEKYDGVDYKPYITIVKMKFGDTHREQLYNTIDYEQRQQKEIERQDAKRKKKEENKKIEK